MEQIIQLVIVLILSTTTIPAGHVVTGDLRIVTDRHIRKLLMKGPQFREQNNINWNKNKRLCKEAVKKYRDTM